MTSERGEPANKGVLEQEDSQCRVCPAGRLQEGTTTLTMERDGSTIVFKGVPADVCDTCGESFVHEDVSADVYEKAEAAVEAGVEVDVRRYSAPTGIVSA